MSILLFLACSSTSPEDQSTVAPKETVEQTPQVKTENIKQSKKESKPAVVSTKPGGIIGGIPILPNPIVLGAIDPKKIDSAIDQQRDAINSCYTQTAKQARANKTAVPMGKVLVKFTIDKNGAVSKVGTKSTSLRHENTERCVNEVIAKAQFPSPEKGNKAIISYPFAFPPQ